MYTPRELQALYWEGKNISQLLREEQGLQRNTRETIEVAYDLQTGSYIAAMENAEVAAWNRNYTSEIANTILSLCEPVSILEAGVGEGTTLSGVLDSGGEAQGELNLRPLSLPPGGLGMPLWIAVAVLDPAAPNSIAYLPDTYVMRI